jgi:hypothetical protein
MAWLSLTAAGGIAGCGEEKPQSVPTSPGEAPAGLHAGWVKTFGGKAAQVGWYVAVDGQGNAVVAGTAEGPIDFGDGPVQTKTSSDVFVAKLDPTGRVLWAKRYGETGFHVPTGLALTSQGEIVLSGMMSGDIDFGAGVRSAAGDSDAFLVKLDPSGKLLWVVQAGDDGVQDGGSVTIDSDGNALWSGTFEGKLDINGKTAQSAGQSDAFLAKIDASGKAIWLNGYGSPGYEGDHGVAVDGAGNVTLAGYYDGKLDVGGGALPDASSGAGDFLVHVDRDGKHLWSHGMVVDTSGGFAYSLSALPNGSLLLAGKLQGSVDLAGAKLTSGDHGIGVAWIDATGKVVQSQVYQGTGETFAFAQPDGKGGVLLAGYFAGSLDLGGQRLTSVGDDDMFIAHLDASGNIVHRGRLGGGGGERPAAIAPTPDGGLIVSGSFTGKMDLGDAPHDSVDAEDAFVARLAW